MMDSALRWLPLFLFCAAVFSLPLPEEQDSEESRKVLGSSVVTSVSVLMENENGTKTAYFADAAGHPVNPPQEGASIGSPVDLLTPDKYQFYTFDHSGNLVTRYMTKDEVRSIIANGQKNNEVKPEQPTFYHNLPTSPDELAFEPTAEETPNHFAQEQLKMHSVVARVQNVLKSQMADKVEAEVPPMTPDTSASWTMILPGNLGHEDEDIASTIISVVGTESSVEVTTIIPENSESLPLGDAPQESSGSGESEHESSSTEEHDKLTSLLSTVSDSKDTTQNLPESTEATITEQPHSSDESESDKTEDSSESTEITEQPSKATEETSTILPSSETIDSAEKNVQLNSDASVAESSETHSNKSEASNVKSPETTQSSGESGQMADAPGSGDVYVMEHMDDKVTHMELIALSPPESASHIKEVVSSDVSSEGIKESLSVLSEENNSSLNKVITSNEKLGAGVEGNVSVNKKEEQNDTKEIVVKNTEDGNQDKKTQSSTEDSQSAENNSSEEDVTPTVETVHQTTESKEDSSNESEASKPVTENIDATSESAPVLNELKVVAHLFDSLTDLFNTVGEEAVSSYNDETTTLEPTDSDEKPTDSDEKPTEVVVTSVSSSQSSSSTKVSSSSNKESTGDSSQGSESVETEVKSPVINKDHDIVVGSESVQKIAKIPGAEHSTPDEIVESMEQIPLIEVGHESQVKKQNALDDSSEISAVTDATENVTHSENILNVNNSIIQEESSTEYTGTINNRLDENDNIDDSGEQDPSIVAYNNALPTTEREDAFTTARDEGVTLATNTVEEVDVIPVSNEETDKEIRAETTTEGTEGSGDEKPTESEETSEGSGWSPTEKTLLNDAGSGSGDGSDDNEHSVERTTKGHFSKDSYKMSNDGAHVLTSSEEALYDVNKYVTSNVDIAETTMRIDEDNNNADDDIYDVEKYVLSEKDRGVTTPMSSDETTTLQQLAELNDEAVNFDIMEKHSTNNDDVSAENIYDIPTTVSDEKDVDSTTPSSDDAVNDTTNADTANDIHDVHNYVNSDTDLGVTTPSSAEESKTDKPSDEEQNDENASGGNIYDVNKYINSDKDLAVTTPSSAEESKTDKPSDEEQNDENASGGNIYDVDKYINSDKDLAVTTLQGEDESTTLPSNADDIYDVNNYVNSDKDLGLTTTISIVETETEKIASMEENEVTTLETTRSEEIEKNSEESTTLLPAEESTQEVITTSEDKSPSDDAAVKHGSVENSSTSDDVDTTTPVSSEMMMNDQPGSGDSENPSQGNIQYYKPPLEASENSVKIQNKEWTKVNVIPTPMKDGPLAIELQPAPMESLGLEASTAHLFEDVQKFADLCNELAFKMWTSLTDKGVSASRSIIMSPFATTSLLSMIFLGARGPTSGQMNDVLKLDDMMTFNPHQVFRNVTDSVLMQNPGVSTAALVREIYSDVNKGKMLEFYKQRVSHFYDGHVEEVDFAGIGDTLRRRTNLFVKRQTSNKVSEYMRGSSLELQPPLAAFSANIFQTDCSSASTEGRDGEMYFTILPATRQRRLVPIPAVVYRSGFMAGYEPGLDATVVSIGTNDAAISTLFVLPGQQGQLAPGDGLPRLEARLINASYTDGAWSKLLRSLLTRTGLEVQIPRFSHRSQLNVTQSLQTMGLNDLFDPTSADLKGVSGNSNDLHVSDVIQVNTFSTCGEEVIGSRHHVEIYPSGPNRSGRQDDENLENVPLVLRPRQARLDVNAGPSGFEDLVQDSIYQMPLALRPRQARLPEGEEGLPRLRLDRPFLYFVRHNPTGFIIHMGRFNPRLLH